MVKPVGTMKPEPSVRREIAVIGAGIMGLGIAWRLAQAGARVTLIERGRPGGGASSAAGGMLSAVAEVRGGDLPPPMRDLCLESLALWPAFAEALEAESGLDTGFRRSGTLLLARTPQEADGLAALFRDPILARHLEELSPAELARRAPAVAPDLLSAFYTGLDAQTDNCAVIEALLVAVARRGVEIRTASARRIAVEQGAVRGVETDAGFMAAEVVVAAPGVWAPALLAASDLAHLDPGLMPVKGQMLALQMPSPAALRQVVRCGPHYLVPRQSGRLVVGATSEPGAWSVAPDAAVTARLHEAAARLVPEAADWPVIEAWVGLRPASPGRLPTIGPCSVEGLYLALGHYRHGILLSAVTSDYLSETILDAKSQKYQSLMAPFLPAA